MLRALSYPGFTWGLSQHAAGFDKDTIEGMLSCALPFQGTTGYQRNITDLMVSSDILTPNLRGGQNDAWRDYQQILAELGFTVSAKLQNTLTLTEISNLLVAGEKEFQDIILMQVLRYQYPNGQKYDISHKLRLALKDSGLSVPSNLIELQMDRGVQIKPGILILRVLLELNRRSITPEISADECRAFLLRCGTNSDWEYALAEILQSRLQKQDLSHANLHARRNIQDWFKLLNETSIFEGDGKSKISLSKDASINIEKLSAICSAEENPNSFWSPRNVSKEARISWFSHYGRAASRYDYLLTSDSSVSEKLDIPSIHDDIKTPTAKITLSKYDPNDLFSKENPRFDGSIEELAAGVRHGMMKRHAKTLLHDQVVEKYANRFVDQGATVLVDPNSVDIFVSWNNEKNAIFEVKTVSLKSFSGRLRLAIGQVKEYGYRLRNEQDIDADQAIIIDKQMPEKAWQMDFLNDYLDIGLICNSSDTETIYASRTDRTSELWP